MGTRISRPIVRTGVGRILPADLFAILPILAGLLFPSSLLRGADETEGPAAGPEATAAPLDSATDAPPASAPEAKAVQRAAKAAPVVKAASKNTKPAAAKTRTAASTKASAGGILLAQSTPPLKADPASTGKPGPKKDTPESATSAAAEAPAPKQAPAAPASGAKTTTVNGKVEKSAIGAPPAAQPKDQAPWKGGPPAGQKAQGPVQPGAGQPAAGAQQAGTASAPGAAQSASAPPAAPGGAQQPGAAGGKQEEQATIVPQPGFKGQPVFISEGKIPILEFLKFLSDYSGLPLLHKSDDPNFATKEIQIAADVKEANDELVKAILEINGFRVYRETLPSGKEVLKVESVTVAQPTTEDAKEKRIIRVEGGTPIVETTKMDMPLGGPSADEIATMVFFMKYTAPRDAMDALMSLISSGPGGGGGGGPGAVARGTKTFSMVEVKNTMMLIITAKFGLLNYIKKLLELIDIPLKEPERIIQVIDVQEAAATDLSSVIMDFLQGQGGGRGGTRGGAGARSRMPRISTSGQGGTPVPPTTSGAPGSTNLYDAYQTSLYPDDRTNKIIVETYSEQDLQDIYMLVRELDIRFDLRRLRTHIYQVRYLKAVEVASDLSALLGGSGSGSMSGLRRTGGTTGTRSTAGNARRTATARSNVPTAGTGGVPGQAGGGQNAPLPSLIVPHEPTNSLLIQAEPEEYVEVLNILSKIDTKRRQVFLEAALVQVTSASALTYTIELLAGNPDDQATRGLFASSFGLTGIDFENFSRVAPDLTDPASVPQGGLFAIMSRGKLPAIVRFFKQNRDSQVLATPFVLADDNMENQIDITETRFIATTNTVNTATTTSQQGEDAGITLAITPTISGSERAVFLQMELTVSEFDETTTSASTLPPKKANTMTSSVTIPDGEVFVVGGLTRQSKAKAISKVPILGDIPILGKLFRSESTAQSQNNLYIFLQAHILTDEEFRDGLEITEQAQEKMHQFDPSLQPVQFDRPAVEKHSGAGNDDAARTTILNPSLEGRFRDRARSDPQKARATTHIPSPGEPQAQDGAQDAGEGPPEPSDAEAPPGARPVGTRRVNVKTVPRAPSVIDRDGWLLAPSTESGGGGASPAGTDTERSR